jgi:hypothetical protein
MPQRRPGHNLVRTKAKKKAKLPLWFMPLIGKALQIGLVITIILFIISTGWQYIYKSVSESYKPNAHKFDSCSNTFIQIKTKPTYGVVFKTNESLIEDIYLTAPEGAATIKSIILERRDWVAVYFSNNFTSTQIGEFLRLSKLEKGAYDYCYVLEQLSLTSGIPIEYVVVDDKNEGISSTVSVAMTQDILRSLEQKPAKKFQKDLLPIRILDDGSKVSLTTFDSFKEQFPNFFKIDEISQEQAFVEVYNATPIDGYASIFSRKWSMLGIDISRVGNATHEPVNDMIAVLYVRNELQFTRTLATIKSSFPEGKVMVKQGRPSNLVTTGDIVVFLLKR